MLSPTIYGCSTTAKVLTRSLPRLSSSTLVGGPSIGGSGWSSVASRSQQDYASAVGGVRFRSNRSRRGLYDGKDIGTGNNVSFSMRATKRKFKPNVFKKRVYRLVNRNSFLFLLILLPPLSLILILTPARLLLLLLSYS